ncbi:MAG: Crp/Fnr family transcriptional regulator [Solobacterium sp.]|nr:Crp/Fnr family transcriptional regulator [Solobacterium sp.]
MSDYLKTIHKSKLFRRVPEEELDSLLEHLDSQLKFYSANQVAVSAGRRVRRVGLILEGTMEMYEQDFWGREHKIDTLKSGSLLLENHAVSGKVTMHTFKTVCSTAVLWFNIREILTLDETHTYNTVLIQDFMKELAKKNLELYSRVSDMDRMSTKEKLLSYLSKEALRHNSDEFDIPYDRRELANYLSVERSAMSAELSSLSKEGYLVTKKNHFKLLKPSSLKD